MNSIYKQLGAMAALCLLSLTAQGAMTFYGYSQLEFGNQKITGSLPGLPATIDETYATDNNFSRLGFIVEEKVAHGFTAIAKFELRIDMTSGSLVTGNQPENKGESFIGLKTRWGIFQFGAVKSPFKYWGGESYDPFASTALEARNHGGMSGHTWSVDPASLGPYLVDPPTLPGNTSFGHDGFMQNSASWKSLKFAGFEIWGSYSFDKADDSLIFVPALGEDTGQDIIIDPVVAYGDYTFGIKYSRDNFEIGFGAFKNKARPTVDISNPPSTSGRKFFTRFTRSKHTVSLQWERIQTKREFNESYESKIYFVGYQYKLNEFSVLAAQYGQSKVDTGRFLPNQEVKYYAAGLIYGLSKTTQIYGGYSKSELRETTGFTPEKAERAVFSVGMRLVF